MSLGKDIVIKRLHNALRAASKEAQDDPEFIGRVVNTICSEFGLDTLASMYISNKVKTIVNRRKAHAATEPTD